MARSTGGLTVRGDDEVISTEANTRSPVGRRRWCALLTALACTVFGSRLIIVSAFSSSVPLLDQWDAEGQALYSPYLKGTLSFADLVASHNGHRILITRLVALAHLEMAGEWNTRLEMIFGAAVLTALVTLLAALLIPLVAPHLQVLLTCFVALIFAFPIDFENTVWGFQSQVYLSLFFGVLAVAAFSAAPAFSLRWFAGLSAAILSYFTFATGVATLPAAATLVALQIVTNSRKRSTREIAAVLLLASIAVAVTAWGAGSAKSMATPAGFFAGLGIFAALTIAGGIPIALYCRHILKTRPSISDGAWVVLGISCWVTIQLVLFAYGRGSLVAPRYLDVVLLVYPMAFVSMFALWDRARGAEVSPRVQRGPVFWVFAVAAAFTVAGCVSVLACSYWSKAADQQTANVRAYLATGDLKQLKERGSANHGVTLAHPYPERQAQVLGDPDLRAILPPDIRPADADNRVVRSHLLLRGAPAAATATVVRTFLTGGPALLAIGVGLFFGAGTARSLVAPAANLSDSTSG